MDSLRKRRLQKRFSGPMLVHIHHKSDGNSPRVVSAGAEVSYFWNNYSSLKVNILKFMGDKKLNKAVAYAVLAGSSGWSLMQCTDLKYARLAFGIYLANGIVGVVDYVIPKENKHVQSLLNGISRWARPIYLPLIAAEAVVCAGSKEQLAYFHLVLPAVYLVLTELLKKNVKTNLLDHSTISNIISVYYSACAKDDVSSGGLCALFNIAAFLGTTYNSMESLLFIGAANISAVQFFKQIFG